MRILKYWKQVEFEPWAKFMIVPETTIEEPHTFFDRIVEAVKASDYSYVLYDRTEKLISERR